MTEVKVGLLETLAIKNWYRFLLYIGGVILILSLFLEPKGIEISRLRAFSLHTIVLSLILWAIEDIKNKIGDYIEYLHQNDRIDDSQYDEWAMVILTVWYLINIVALIIWILFISPTLF
ncbi:hypothetical protein DRP05_04970 [Archaeoglobales archaeon]|nr:MAG: hypothetical protein DRP05_04970 [Archaeoglobales archaeon]